MWIPIKTTYHNELKIADFLTKEGLEWFIPMRYDAPDLAPQEVRIKAPLVPAIHNLLFIHHDYSAEWGQWLTQACQYPTFFFPKERTGKEKATITDREMQRFMQISNPDIAGTFFVTQELLKNKKPVWVQVTAGPLKGFQGKFIRYGKRHYVMLEITGISALMCVRYRDVQPIQIEET